MTNDWLFLIAIIGVILIILFFEKIIVKDDRKSLTIPTKEKREIENKIGMVKGYGSNNLGYGPQ